ncbi:MAG TPA: acyl-CoA dehydrogenase family protein [Gemmatimonadaceae bacterium]|jgi:alkylation response protein AidB-like acyl-CoA dehydrogenase|nr:acyl-CoA dehydrogenase family protein [Gemmatimonadaceae bacterium]
MTIDTSAARPPLTTLSDEETMFRDAVAGFAEEEVRPRVQQMEREGKIDPKLIAKFFEMGLMAVEVPESLGGADGSLMMVALAVEEISKIDPAAAILMDVQNTLVNYPIRTYGSDYLKSTYLPQLAREKVGAYALSEPASGSDAFGMQSRAEQRGGGWVLTGRKLWITNGAEAEIYVVFANANPSAGYKGITAFVVERGFAGFGVGKKEDKLGIRASSTTELILDGVQVPNENVLGPVGQGYKIAIDTLNGGRVGIGAQMIGVAQGALRAALDFVTERRQFGRAIADFQAVQFQLAQARAELEGARLLVYNAARLKDAGQDIAMEGAMAKLISSQVAERVTSLALELHGGYGYTKEYPAEKFYRDAKIGTIYEGTSNMQLQTIAKGLLAKH